MTYQKFAGVHTNTTIQTGRVAAVSPARTERLTPVPVSAEVVAGTIRFR
jgi:hypothetical protein